MLLCVQSGSTLADPNRFKFDADDFYLKSPERDARTLWRELPEACDNTLLIAERCDVVVHRGRGPLHAAVPRARRARSEQSWFVKEVERGLHGATPAASATTCAARPTTRPRSSARKGYAGYFLVVADFINWAKDNGIRVGPGRGSGAGVDVAPTPWGSPTSTRSCTA